MSKTKREIIEELNMYLQFLHPLVEEVGMETDDFKFPLESLKIPMLKEGLAWIKRVAKTNEWRGAQEFGKFFKYSNMPMMRAMGNTDLREYRDAKRHLQGLARVLTLSGRPALFNAKLRKLA